MDAKASEALAIGFVWRVMRKRGTKSRLPKIDNHYQQEQCE